jgi:hypothetical protein
VGNGQLSLFYLENGFRRPWGGGEGSEGGES